MKNYFATRAASFGILALLAIGSSLGLSVISCETSYSQISAQVYFNYVPPDWAPPYDNESTVRYYYLPDYDMYYDVWERQYYYLDDGRWVASYDLPPMWADISLGSAFIVLIDRDVDRPWYNHDYYVRNYPHHGHEQYRDIVVKNRIITNLRPGHELVPRAYNENNRRVTFMQHPTQPQPPNPNRGGIGGEQRPGGQPGQPSARPPQPYGNKGYHQQVHEVPMKSIAPSMPVESRKFNYGGGQNRAPRAAPAPRNAPTPAQGRPQGGQPNKGGGNQPNRGGGGQDKNKH